MTPTFEQFWNLYGRKVGKRKTALKWNRMTKKQRLDAIEGISRLKEYYQSKGYNLPHPLTYLNGERWEDEYPADAVIGNEDNVNVNDNKNNSQSSIINCQLAGSGCRTATKQELEALQAFCEALLSKEPAKPYRWKEFQNLVAALTIPYVTEHNGIIHLAVLISGKPERITDFMIDYYDSYTDFCHLLTLHFPEGKVTFAL